MTSFRQLTYVTTLARERHFARAAAACNVTQPTLSAGIKQIETSLGVLIFERNTQFVGITPEGERVVAWAQRTLGGFSELGQEISALRHGLAGELRIGVVPSMMAAAGLLSAPYQQIHPRVSLIVVSLNSANIQRGLDDFTLDAGLTYLDNEPLVHVRPLELYRERYELISLRSAQALPMRSTISWAEAATRPLCLLTEDMQNRRILNGCASRAGCELSPKMQSTSLLALLSAVRMGGLSTILPHSFRALIGAPRDLDFVPLENVGVSPSMGVVVPAREPLPAIAQAFLAVASAPAVGESIRHAFDRISL
jgi:DNA-binding transcriptional LysR family regulator